MTGRQPLVVPAAGAVVVAHRILRHPAHGCRRGWRLSESDHVRPSGWTVSPVRSSRAHSTKTRASACSGINCYRLWPGTLADARHFKAARALLLIHEFDTPLTRADRHAPSANVFAEFAVRLGATPSKQSPLPG